MAYLILASVLTIAILTVLYWLKTSRKKYQPSQPAYKPPPGITHCPLCRESITGTRLYSKLLEYPDQRKMLEIRGCGHCYKSPTPKERICPRCKKRMDADDIIMASYLQENGITKVVIKGCRHCYKR